MTTELESGQNRALIFVSILQALLKGFSVFYFLLLPILYATKVISAQQLGYVGALLVVGILLSALAVTYRLHSFSKKKLLTISLALLFGATILLFWSNQISLLITAYILIGLATGLGMSTINALAAQFTTQGKRFKALAKIAMLTDVTRIIYPLIAGAIYLTLGFSGLIYFALLMVFGFGLSILLFLNGYKIDAESVIVDTALGGASIRDNKPFWFIIKLEFLDSFASSQLFVFLPALLVFKNFTIENALIMQSVVFVGYLSGRWLVGLLAHKFDGFIAVGLAEVGMIISIVFLLVMPPSAWLYVPCFLLGLFSRGTSPVIKALAFDRLKPDQMKRGSAIHVIGGDSGSAIGQFAFGLLLALLGVTAPFIAAVFCAGVVALACFVYRNPVPETTV